MALSPDIKVSELIDKFFNKMGIFSDEARKNIYFLFNTKQLKQNDERRLNDKTVDIKDRSIINVLDKKKIVGA